MDYEKKYNEALERARKAYNAIPPESSGARKIIEDAFPELRESEDEKIRRTLVEYFGPQAQLDFIRGVPIQKIRDWLEKQKEQIPYTDFVIKPHKGDDNNPYDMRVSEAQEYAIKRGFGIPFNDGEVYVDERHLTQTIGNILRWADEHPKEQNPRWEDYKDKVNIPYCSSEQEWSEEDTEMYINVASSLRGYACGLENEEHKRHIQKGLDWLENRFKSLRPDSYKNCNSRWKPTEEQMDRLFSIVAALRKDYCDDMADFLANLYADLKKLGVKEEPEYYQHFDPDC